MHSLPILHLIAGNMLCTSMEKVTTYTSIKYGDEAAPKNGPAERGPIYKSLPRSRRPESKSESNSGLSLRAEKTAIEAGIIQAPTNHGLLKEATMKLTDNEKIAHSNVWRSHQEKTESVKKRRGKVYSLLLVLMAVLITEQLSILLFQQGDQVGNAVYYYDCFTKRVEAACQAGVSYYSQDLLEDKTTQLKMVI